MTELKCCPFCGGKAKYMEIKDFFISRFVTCTKCGIETPRNFLNRKDAIKRWNTRTPMANIVEKLEREKSKSIYDSDSVIDVKGAYTKAINIVKQEINKEN